MPEKPESKTRKPAIRKRERAQDPGCGADARLFDLVPVPCHCLDGRGRIVRVNEAWLKLMHASRDEVLNAPIESFLSAGSRSTVLRCLASSAATCPALECVMARSDGSEVDVTVDIRDGDDSLEFRQAHFLRPKESGSRQAGALPAADHEAMFQLAMESSHEVFWAVDAEYRYTYVSPSVFRLRGVPPEKLLGHGLDQALAPHSCREVRDLFDELRRDAELGTTDRVGRIELELLPVDGETRWVETVVRPVVDADGRCIGFMGAGRDIGHRRLMEERLRASERVMRTLLDTAVDDVGLLSPDGEIVFVNRHMSDTFGIDRETARGRSFSDCLPEEKRSVWRELIRKAVEDGRPVRQMGDLGGKIFDITTVPVHGPGGAVFEVAVYARDVTEKTRATDALWHSEERYRRIVETANEGILSLDADGRIVFANKTVADFFGHAIKDVVGASLSGFIPKEEQARYARHFAAFANGSLRYEQRFVHGEGAEIWARVSGTPVLSDAGEYAGAFVMIADITDSKLVERSLRESEARYRRIVETANEGIFYAGAKGFIRFANKVVCRMLGYAVYEILNKPISFILLPEDVPILSHNLDRRRQGLSDHFEQRYRRKDGSELWTLVSASPVFSDNGEFQGSLAMVSDITDRKRAEAKLAKSELNYRNLFEKSVEGLYQATPDGRFVSVNPALARLTGYDSPRDFMESVPDIGTKFYTDPGDGARMIDILTRHGEIRQYEVLIRRKGGGTIWVSINGRLSRGNDGEPFLYEGSVVDITGRKRVEEALRLTQFSVDMAPVSIYWVDSRGRYVYVNDHGCGSLGYKRRELLTMSVPEVCPMFQEKDWNEYWVERRQQGIMRFETLHRCADGQEVPVDIISHFKVYGGAEYLFVYAYDLTDRKRTEHALDWSRALLNEVQRISLTGGWEHDLATGASHWTDGQFRLFGLEPEEQAPNIDLVLERHVHPEDKVRLMETWATLLRDKEPLEVEFRCLRRDGSEGVLVGVVVPELGPKGELRRVFGSTRDVTHERAAARELRLSHERLLAILDGIDADIYVSELDTHEVLFMNAHIKDSYHVSGDNFLCHKIFRGNVRQCSFCPKPDLLDEQGSPVGTIIHERFNPMAGRWHLNHDRAIEWLEGRLVHMHMAADITELKTMEQDLKEAMAEAQAASLAKNEFLANMSHEIRTPLNGLLGMLQLLQLTRLGEEQREYLDIATTSGRSLLQILNDILDISKIESGKLELDDQDLELGDLLDSVLSVFRHQAFMRGIQITGVTDESLPNHFVADKVRLRQILFNLVGNATKFTESGSVSIESYPLEHRLPDGRSLLFFVVSDTGIGIPDDKLDRIFDPFTQVDGSFTRKYQGTGLGLGIVRRLVVLMGGSIAVISELGKGTMVAFTVAVRPIAREESVPAVTLAACKPRRLRILVVEDERTNRSVAQRLLSKLGHEVACVESGEEALKLLGEEAFDCVLMDIQMPGLDGLETTMVLRGRLGLKTPVIALTAHAMEGDRKRFIEAGMDGYVAKPFELGELQAELERVRAESGC
jgi:PAS domain S-box-containing protein